MNLEPWDRILATFNPKRRDDLLPEALPFIGQRFVWRASFQLEEDEGQYGGQRVFVPDDLETTFPGWVPAEDLVDPEPVLR